MNSRPRSMTTSSATRRLGFARIASPFMPDTASPLPVVLRWGYRISGPTARCAERGLAWTARFRRLARDYERLPTVLAGLHFIAFACLLLHRVVPLTLRP